MVVEPGGFTAPSAITILMLASVNEPNVKRGYLKLNALGIRSRDKARALQHSSMDLTLLLFHHSNPEGIVDNATTYIRKVHMC